MMQYLLQITVQQNLCKKKEKMIKFQQLKRAVNLQLCKHAPYK